MLAACSAACRRRACCASPTCVRSGATWPAASVPRIVWHPAHRACMNTSRPAALRPRPADRAPAAACASSQRSKSRLGFGDDVERHVRVLQPAELRALAAEDARTIGLHPDRRGVAGNQIALAVEVRHPEAVDHVARRDLQHDRAVDRNVEFVRGDHAPARDGVVVPNLPPPLVADDLDRHGRRRMKRADRAPGPDARHEQSDKQNDGRRDGDAHRARENTFRSARRSLTGSLPDAPSNGQETRT